MPKHATEIGYTNVVKDGDFDAIVYRVRDTGSSLAVVSDRYKHTIEHGLNREPVGCEIIMKDKTCDVFVVSKDSNKIVVQFTAEHADVNIRIW